MPDQTGVIMSNTGPRLMYRHFNETDDFGFHISYDMTTTELQSSYKFDGGLLYVFEEYYSPSQHYRLFSFIKIDNDIHSQYLKEYYEGTIRDRTDTRLVSGLTGGLAISIGKYIPLTFEYGLTVSGYTEFDERGFEYIGLSNRYASSLSFNFNIRKIISKLR
jgi:hypothetical protein